MLASGGCILASQLTLEILSHAVNLGGLGFDLVVMDWQDGSWKFSRWDE